MYLCMIALYSWHRKALKCQRKLEKIVGSGSSETTQTIRFRNLDWKKSGRYVHDKLSYWYYHFSQNQCIVCSLNPSNQSPTCSFAYIWTLPTGITRNTTALNYCTTHPATGSHRFLGFFPPPLRPCPSTRATKSLVLAKQPSNLQEAPVKVMNEWKPVDTRPFSVLKKKFVVYQVWKNMIFGALEMPRWNKFPQYSSKGWWIMWEKKTNIFSLSQKQEPTPTKDQRMLCTQPESLH